MLRITELKLPLNHSESDFQSAILYSLQIDLSELVCYHIFRQSHDARKRDAIQMVYTIDVEVTNEAKILAKFADDIHINQDRISFDFKRSACPQNSPNHYWFWAVWIVSNIDFSANGF